MSTAAQNALLKTLEEPPGPGYLVLLATSADALLPTTRSRCQHIPFRGLPLEFVIAQVLVQHVDEVAAAVGAGHLAVAEQIHVGQELLPQEMGCGSGMTCSSAL